MSIPLPLARAAVRRRVAALATALVALTATAAVAAPDAPSAPPAPSAPNPAAPGLVTPVPSLPTTSEQMVGEPATARPLRVPPVPQNPFLAPNGRSGIHNDGWQSDTYRQAGPLGRDPQTLSASLGGICGSVTFNRAGRIVTTCIGVTRALYLLDAETLAVVDSYPLPRPAPGSGVGGNPFQNFSGGAYFYLDHRDRAVIGTVDGRILTIATDGDRLRVVRQRDLTGALADGQTINSALPGSDGVLWFVTKTDGVVGTIDPRSGRIRTVRLGRGSDGQIENSLAVGSHGEAYIATNRRLYRFDHRAGRPVVTWSVRYRSIGSTKPGQVDDGTGTTPTVLSGGYVAITDNADPMNVVVYRTAKRPRGPRTVCEVPVFGRGASATENSLIGAGRTLIVENNHGYTGPDAVSAGRTTTPGFARVDIARDGSGCRKVWTSTTTPSPSVVAKLSLATGLVYAYTKPAGDPSDAWYWTALDVRTGREVWRIRSGAGPLFNNNYAGLALGPDGTAYLGVLAGLTALRDGPAA